MPFVRSARRHGVCLLRRVGAGVFATGLALLIAHGRASGQTETQSPDPTGQILFGLGLGGGGASSLDADGGLVAQLDVHHGPHHVTLRALGLSNWSNFPDGSGDSLGEVALLYGRQRRARPGYFTVAAGPGFVSGEGFRGAPLELRRTVGLSVLAEASLQSTPIGAGLQVFGNLNSVSSFAGVAVLLHLGWSR